jgi:hypothetical protein
LSIELFDKATGLDVSAGSHTLDILCHLLDDDSSDFTGILASVFLLADCDAIVGIGYDD